MKCLQHFFDTKTQSFLKKKLINGKRFQPFALNKSIKTFMPQSLTENPSRHRFGNRRQRPDGNSQPFERIEHIEPFEPS